MRCAYAFLLVPKPSMLHLERLVVIGVDTDYSHYGVYRPHVQGKFPDISQEIGIAMTKYSIDIPGTYLRAYCSFDVPVNDIVENVKTNMEKITSTSHLNFNVDEKKVQECLAHIQNMPLGINDYSPINFEDLRRMNYCSAGEIFALNFRNQLSVKGAGFNSIRRESTRTKWVKFREPIEAHDIFLQEQFHGNLYVYNSNGQFTDSYFTLLVWYQGHLHRFFKNASESWFSAETRIGSEAMNAEKIQSGLLKKYRYPMNFNLLIEQIQEEYKSWHCSRILAWCSQPVIKQKKLSAENKVRQFDLKSLPIYGLYSLEI
ncbi:BgTH12-02984 [Blumeria graminis f. sp. triticale]|uniref:BgTH12-02984 n=1 Tax=Blumeria graminis f. sp. triticale TaxID=1689686 RepID=A0A9W4GF87_BLUGR|nr:BgTH12-02984 [Blumeria graminis f. sp. triticale]